MKISRRPTVVTPLNERNERKECNNQRKRNECNNQNERQCEWDLNGPDFQERLKNYFLHGVPGSDARGHSINVQARFTPLQAHLLENIRSKVPRSQWSTQSDMVRSLLSLGCFVALKLLSKKDSSLQSYFRTLELLNVVEKNMNEAELYGQVQKCIFEMNTSRADMGSKVDELEEILKKKGKI